MSDNSDATYQFLSGSALAAALTSFSSLARF